MVPAAMRRWKFPAMGTTVSVVTEATAVEQAGDEVRRLFAEWERRLSRFRPDSELSRLNADAGRPVVVSHLLFEVLEAALRAARATAGLYDPTLLRALERLGYDRSFEQVGVDVPAAPGPVPPGGGWRRVELDPKGRTVTLPPGVGVDLGGIAKGMAVDAAVERHHLLDPRHARPAQTGLWSVTVAASTCAGRGRRQDRVHPRADSGHRLSRAQAPGGPAGGPVGCVAARRLLAGGLGRPGGGLVVASLSMTWVATRAAGYTAFALLTASVALGLLLSSPLRPTRWPRFATTEPHRFVTLLTLLFIAIHVLVALLDSFIGFSLSDVLVPFTSNYRRVWMGLGIVSAYLAAALWASSWLQRRIGYRWWRRLHFGTFGVYVGAALHGLGSGSDSGWAWSRIIYVASFALIGGLLVMRLPDRDGRRPPPTRAARPRASQAPPDAAEPAGVANGAFSAGSASGGGAVAHRGSPLGSRGGCGRHRMAARARSCNWRVRCTRASTATSNYGSMAGFRREVRSLG